MSRSDIAGCCWPEQEAVWKWMAQHSIKLTPGQEDELKAAVSQYRIVCEQKLADKDRQLLDCMARVAELEKENAELQQDRVAMMQYRNLREHFGALADEVLGPDYYNMGMDVYECDRITCEDIARHASQTWLQRLRQTIRRAIDNARRDT